jgi:hypothetical protein
MTDRLAAKSLADYEIDESAYKPDFEVTSRFQSLATELERLSLLGIGAYGFLLTTVMSDKGIPNETPYLLAMRTHAVLLGIGVMAFATAAAFALASNFLTDKCLGCQIDIIRTFKRLDSGLWDQNDQQTNRAYAEETQRTQKRVLFWNRALLVSSTGLLCLGAFAVALTFARILFSNSAPQQRSTFSGPPPMKQ